MGSSLCFLSVLGLLCLNCGGCFSWMGLQQLYLLALWPRRERRKRVRKSKAKYRKATGDRAQCGTATELRRNGKSKGLSRRITWRQEGAGSWAKAQLLPRTELPRHRSSHRHQQCWQWPWQSAPWQSGRAPRTASARSAHRLMIALSGQMGGTSEQELQDFSSLVLKCFAACPCNFTQLPPSSQR